MYDDTVSLLRKISLGEDSTLEFKSVIEKRNRDSISDEIAAFANSESGGVILVGVDDAGIILGLEADKIKEVSQLVTEIANDSVTPPVNVLTEKLILAEKNILKVSIKYSQFVHKSKGGYFYRQGDSKREMSPDMLHRLMQSRSHARVISYAETPVTDALFSSLQKQKYERFLGDANEDVSIQLQKRRLLAKYKTDIVPSVAGLLMCHSEPREHLYNSYIQAVCYSGTERHANFQVDAQDFAGTLDEQIIDAYKFCLKHNQVAARKVAGRVDYPQYDMLALLEAIVNAVVHRDYSLHGSHIRLFIYADRLELMSPGLLVNTLNVDELQYNQVTRNELLARLLSELPMEEQMQKIAKRKNFLEQRGEGVSIILRQSEALSGRLPVYEVRGGELHLTIYAATPPPHEQ